MTSGICLFTAKHCISSMTILSRDHKHEDTSELSIKITTFCDGLYTFKPSKNWNWQYSHWKFEIWTWLCVVSDLTKFVSFVYQCNPVTVFKTTSLAAYLENHCTYLSSIRCPCRLSDQDKHDSGTVNTASKDWNFTFSVLRFWQNELVLLNFWYGKKSDFPL